MNRALIVAAVAALAAFGAERVFASMKKDIERYDRMREMSGEEPLLKELFSTFGGAIGKSGPTGFVAGLTSDVMRYAKMKAM